MQKLIYIFVFLNSFYCLSAQTVTDREIEFLLKDLIAKMKSNPNIKNVAVSDFTNIDSEPTKLGKYLAEEFSYILSNIDKSISVVDRSKLKMLFEEVGMDAKGLIDPNSAVKLGKIKGIDSIIYATMTESGDVIRIIVKLISVETSVVLASARGDITKNTTIRDASAENSKMNTKPEIKSVVKPSPIDKPKTNLSLRFQKDNLFFDLLECRQSGSTIECFFDITNSSMGDINLNIYGDNSRAINAQSGYEYKVSTLRVSDKVNSNQVEKTLIANTTIKAVITFSNAYVAVSSLSKLEIHCWSATSGYFNIEIRNISTKP